MNSDIERSFKQALETCTQSARSAIDAAYMLGRLKLSVDRIISSLSDTVTANFYGGTAWFWVYNREDLQTIMTLAPLWTKDKSDTAISYSAEVDGIVMKIYAADKALPQTCHVVEEEVEIPARTEKRTRIVCDTPEIPVAEVEALVSEATNSSSPNAQPSPS